MPIEDLYLLDIGYDPSLFNIQRCYMTFGMLNNVSLCVYALSVYVPCDA